VVGHQADNIIRQEGDIKIIILPPKSDCESDAVVITRTNNLLVNIAFLFQDIIIIITTTTASLGSVAPLILILVFNLI
jgi:hypothetical protein